MTATIQAFLRHLHDAGCADAPIPLGIDFGLARPTTRIYDVANALYWWVPLISGALPMSRVALRCAAIPVPGAAKRPPWSSRLESGRMWEWPV
ncbi:hypothetical protein Skr01_57370 [Sphaerisporangium krabiense]|uniref:Aminoglycoside phosphotransferase domain-containing protein n=1 Tax=Sphaerisporangium krabiense TaxID=763782 RepID=A0A7W9DSA8_9ACTN|nr:hypothetical protein [Sphaerisporangium krabiense]MBB5629497.1 hypothetical protein [Sphaerisporangium krabiense]GII65652.1 hypothetical protein Skr01_57370 [Sphaerisporangium krabiense]